MNNYQIIELQAICKELSIFFNQGLISNNTRKKKSEEY